MLALSCNRGRSNTVYSGNKNRYGSYAEHQHKYRFSVSALNAVDKGFEEICLSVNDKCKINKNGTHKIYHYTVGKISGSSDKDTKFLFQTGYHG